MAAPKSAFWRQVSTLTTKNLTILYARHPASTIYTALLLPIILTVYLGIGRNLNSPQNDYGIAEPRPVRSLRDGLAAADGSARDTVVFVNNGLAGGEIDRVIGSLSQEVTDAGKIATTIEDPTELGRICRSSFRATTSCYGAVVFHSSPSEGSAGGVDGDSGGIWNYTLRGDGALGSRFRVDDDDNDAQVYTLPLQRAVDSAIAVVTTTTTNNNDDDNNSQSSTPLAGTREWGFTDETEDERQASARRRYQQTIIDYLGVSFVLALIGMSYHLPGHIATERERGLSQLIDSMMSTRHEWEAQAVRMVANLYSFFAVYVPGWIAASVIARSMIWRETNIGVVIVFFVLGGLALTSQAVLGASFFKKAQLSGVVNSLVYVLLGVLAQALPDPGTGAVTALSLLFMPCSFVFFIKSMARFEAEGQPMDLLRAPPNSASALPGIAIWVFLIVQFLVYPLLAALVERRIHGIGSESRRVYKGDGARPEDAVIIHGLTKVYSPGLFRRAFSFVSKPRPSTVAVNNLDLTAKRGEILALLGANGSGKSTTLDAIAGISRFNQGSISIDASGGIGIAPQKNVLWDELTVAEHIAIFNQLKSPAAGTGGHEDQDQLIHSIGLSTKRKAQSKTLSGGQKRKLQLGMMLTGGSAVCCVDEVSSGIDALSRRKIWDILLSERGRRTIILTTHFLDEADLLADNIAILSRGSLRAEGSSVALKNALGDGYRVHVLDAKDVREPPEVGGVAMAVSSNTITYTAPSSKLAAEVIRALEGRRIPYRISSPNIEDVFLNVAEEVRGEDLKSIRDGPTVGSSPTSSQEPTEEKDKDVMVARGGGRDTLGLQSGRQAGFLEQTPVLVQKRFTLFKTNWIPYAIVFVVPIVAAAVMQLLVADEGPTSCDPADLTSGSGNLDNYREALEGASIAAGPSSAFSSSAMGDLLGFLAPPGSNGSNDTTGNNISLSDSYQDLSRFIEDNRRSITPGGLWAGSGTDAPPTIAYRTDANAVFAAVILQNLLSITATNISIAAAYAPFDSVIPSSTLTTAQLAIYFSIALSIVPAFFGLYPNVERRSQVRGLQYSSGVRSLPLWASHLLFDFGVFLAPLLLAAVIFATSSDIWFAPGYLFPVFLLYGVTSILLSYVLSLLTSSQVATFAAIMAYNGVGFAVYLIAFLYIITFSPATVSDRNILIGHYTISAVFPVASVCRALLVGLNTFSLACSGTGFGDPGALNAYGGPILYLAVQAILLFSILLYNDSGNKLPAFLTRKSSPSAASSVAQANEDPEVASERVHVDSISDDDGLQVRHVTKKFGSFTAVDDVSFGVRHGEVFALLGPNGAGKSTTISLIRGDIQPSRSSSGGGGDVLVEKVSVTAQRALARSNLGVCPQFDAVDAMTVAEHLRHYARLRGVPDAEDQVRAVIRAVGLDAHVDVPAQHLSGGNRRKLSLGIALTGNPSVMLLDEPSSGLDAAAKRVMWRTLAGIVPGRSILLTTHSMEEADALAGRAGIVAQRMLAVGEVGELRSRFGDSLYVHLVSRTAPHSTEAEMERMRRWVVGAFPSARVEAETYHGQMRFSVSASDVLQRNGGGGGGQEDLGRDRGDGDSRAEGSSRELSAIGRLIVMLEENRDVLGIEHHSVSPTTLSDVFLAIVGQHNVQEEGYAARPGEKKINWRKILLGF
ncbi:ABC transporter [Colletotrichum higginsianum IMI 349063]|uniref:ABC transporter n=2 Tax=Colletotrichum higginsianum TaxID=80884 RepID=A0A1B7YEK0_COLHI|nr:ABC transporter [Colletotrichum higginsianum IMI 349063]OBR10449.1 ABC transporter [Colletotrichum higginsianum IMI 349063]TID06438.1 ATP-binding cassette sub-family A member 3 [Colletotrichum higginsianum]